MDMQKWNLSSGQHKQSELAVPLPSIYIVDSSKNDPSKAFLLSLSRSTSLKGVSLSEDVLEEVWIKLLVALGQLLSLILLFVHHHGHGGPVPGWHGLAPCNSRGNGQT